MLLLEYNIDILLVLWLPQVVIYNFVPRALLAEDLEPIDCRNVLHRSFLRVQLWVGLNKY